MSAPDPTALANFSVCQFFANGSHEYVQRWITLAEAVPLAFRAASSVGAWIGTTQRVIITDGDDDILWQWEFSKGVTFPP